MAVQKRTLKNGKTVYIARYRDAAGKEHSKSFTNAKPAKSYLSDMESKVARGSWIDPRIITVKELVEEHRDQAANKSTRAGRTTLLNNLGDLGEMNVHIVKPSHIEAWMQTLTDGRPWVDNEKRKKLSPSTAQMLAAILHGVFTKAVNDDVVERHPMRGIKIRRVNVTVQRDDIPTEEEVRKLINTASQTAVGRAADLTLATMVQVAAETGLRAGELCGLRVRNVNLLRREINVVEQIAERTGEFAPLKTESSRRVVPILPSTAELIAAQLARVPRGRDETVFCRSTGRPLTSGQVGSRFRKLAERAGVDCTFHALRHFYASRLIESGAQVILVQRAMGHASASMTLNVYGHLFPGADGQLREMLVGVRDFCGIDGPDGADVGSLSAGQG